MSAEDDVRMASEQFYAALNRMANGDDGPLAEVWSHSPTVTTMHPIGGREVGWEAVRGSFEQVAQRSSDGQIGLKDQRIQILGDMAYEVAIEQGHLKISG
ncbi:MAG: nuclear transport factor 2 family protein, partial [Polaromonas sp.]|nr:nuclear transport factor 2 family protein [Polaromonas sp.]